MLDFVVEEKEEVLWLRYRQAHDPSIREKLIKQYAPLVRYVAGKVAMGMPNSVDFDDLVGFGVFGLLDAIDKYDPAKNVKFKTYAVTRIRGAIFDELRSLDWVPRSVRQMSKEIEMAIQYLESSLGRAASDEEISKELGVSMDEYQKMILRVSSTSIISLNDVWYTNEENDKVSIIDGVESPVSLQPDSIIEQEEVKRVIINAISELPEKEKKVLILYYYEDLTLKEIGQVLEVTESRVSQLHTKAILRLRTKLTNVKKGIF